MKQGAGRRGLEVTCLVRWVALGCVVLGGCEMRRESDVASVNGVAIPRHQVRLELRAMLWRRGEAWDALDETTRQARRKEALDRCVEEHLLEVFARQQATTSLNVALASEQEFQRFLKQFEPPEGWKPRFAMQHLSEVQVREQITAEVMQTGAIETWLKAQQGDAHIEKQEAEARLWFEAHRESLRLPQRAKVSHIFLTTHDVNKPDRSAEITELHRRLVTGEATLASLAARHSEDERSKKAGGSLGWIRRDRVAADFWEHVSTLPLNQPSAPFRTALGWHIAVVHERHQARLPTFHEVKDEVIAMLASQWRDTAVKRLVQGLREKARVEVNPAVLDQIDPER